MNILVTGGLGYIGAHTCVELLKKGHFVVIIDHDLGYDNTVYSNIKKVSNSTNVKLYVFDMRFKEYINDIFKKYNFDAVIHFAGLKAVGESVRDPLKYYRNNIDITLNLLETMDCYNCDKLIFSSSATVYGSNKSPLTENEITGVGITNPYGKTKHFIENILEDYGKTKSNLKITSLRYFNPVGAHSSGDLGENPGGIPNNLFPYLLRVASGKKGYEELKIFGDDYNTRDGTGERDYIHVEDLANGHLKALENIKNGYNVYNLGTGKGTTVLELIKCFEKVNNIKLPYKITERRPGDLDSVYCDPSKAQKELNWKAEKSLEDMCKDGWNFESNNF